MDSVTKRINLNDSSLIKLVSLLGQKENEVAKNSTLIRKGFAPDIETKFVDSERSAIHTINTKTIDRDREIILPSGVDLSNYQKNPIVLWAHDYHSLPIGKSLWIRIDKNGNLVSKTKFGTHPRADEIYQHMKEFPLATSIGFVPEAYLDEEDFTDDNLKALGLNFAEVRGARRVYTKVSLLEYSIVPIPSNPDALQIAISKGWVSSEEAKDEKRFYINFDNPIDEKIKELADYIVETENGKEEINNSSNTEPVEEKGQEEQRQEEEVIPEDPEKACGGKRKPKKDVDGNISCPECGMLLDLTEDEEIDDGVPEKSVSYWKGWKPPREESETINKDYDIAAEPSIANSHELNQFCKFLGCKVKNTYENVFCIPRPLVGSYLAGFKVVSEGWELKDTRNYYYAGTESPPSYSVVRLNSSTEDDFLIEGVRFYKSGETSIVVKSSKDWIGNIWIQIYTRSKDKDFNKQYLKDVNDWVQENNFLRNEAFSLRGEFIEVDEGDTWDTVVLGKSVEGPVKRAQRLINNDEKEFGSRGMLFVGPPGTGKTKTGRILMTQTDHTFIWVSSRDFSKMDSVNALDLAFKMSRDLAPTILFLEDIDGWLYGQNSIDLLKTELDGIRKNKGVITILTTNFPEKLPDALLDRPGRFHDVLEFGHPTDEIRKEMLEKWCGNSLSAEEIDVLVEKTDGYSGAHMRELVEYAEMVKDEEEISLSDALSESLVKLERQKELIRTIRGETPPPKPETKSEDEIVIENADTEVITEVKNVMEDLEQKAGRVISERNRNTIQDAINALQNLLISTDIEETEEDPMLDPAGALCNGEMIEDMGKSKKDGLESVDKLDETNKNADNAQSQSVDDEKLLEIVQGHLKQIFKKSSEVDIDALIEERMKRAKGKVM